MKTVQEHYAEHLAPVYLWSVGGAEQAFSLAEAELDALHLPAAPGDPILDLGAGFGMHAIPLARRGATVTAVDSSPQLLASLDELAGGLSIHSIQSDLMGFLEGNCESYAAILCMGDTIAHLPAMQDVDTLLALAKRALRPGGALILTFRDYTMELKDEHRFISVRADDARIHTCFLEYQAGTVSVNDIVHERSPEGWQTRVSVYNKLRIPPDALVESMNSIGFHVKKEAGLRGMVRLVAELP